MKKQILAVLLVSVFTFGCTATKTVAQDVTAKVTFLDANQYGKVPGDVKGKCNGTKREMIKYIGNDGNRTVPPNTHQVWAYLNNLNCSDNTDVNGMSMLFPVGTSSTQTVTTTATASMPASKSMTSTETTTVSQSSQTPGVIPEWAIANGKKIKFVPQTKPQAYGCAAKLWQGLFGQISIYNGYLPNQAEVDEMSRYIMSLPVGANGSEDVGYRSYCYEGQGRSSVQVAQTQYVQTQTYQTQPAPPPVQRANAPAFAQVITPAYVEGAPTYVAPAPAVAPAPKMGPGFYAEYIRKSGYTVSGWQKANCLEVDGKIGPQTKKSIDDIMGVTGTQSGCKPGASASATASGPGATATASATSGQTATTTSGPAKK